MPRLAILTSATNVPVREGKEDEATRVRCDTRKGPVCCGRLGRLRIPYQRRLSSTVASLSSIANAAMFSAIMPFAMSTHGCTLFSH
jgi:hypothetical protein